MVEYYQSDQTGVNVVRVIKQGRLGCGHRWASYIGPDVLDGQEFLACDMAGCGYEAASNTAAIRGEKSAIAGEGAYLRTLGNNGVYSRIVGRDGVIVRLPKRMRPTLQDLSSAVGIQIVEGEESPSSSFAGRAEEGFRLEGAILNAGPK